MTTKKFPKVIRDKEPQPENQTFVVDVRLAFKGSRWPKTAIAAWKRLSNAFAKLLRLKFFARESSTSLLIPGIANSFGMPSGSEREQS
ncbi:hypothetical protein HN588_15365 [Candidatus Bathyarchaeota archaeon]|nr:hypothetical protein [Candidatus Bathyarchaeota archaeon]